MSFKLYNAPQSTCSQRVRFVLNAKGLPFDEVKLNLLEGDQLKPEYLKLNPNGKIPAIVDSEGPDGKPFHLDPPAKAPELPAILLEDLAALTGLIFAMIGVALTIIVGEVLMYFASKKKA